MEKEWVTELINEDKCERQIKENMFKNYWKK